MEKAASFLKELAQKTDVINKIMKQKKQMNENLKEMNKREISELQTFNEYLKNNNETIKKIDDNFEKKNLEELEKNKKVITQIKAVHFENVKNMKKLVDLCKKELERIKQNITNLVATLNDYHNTILLNKNEIDELISNYLKKTTKFKDEILKNLNKNLKQKTNTIISLIE